MIIKKIINSIWDELVYGGHLTSLGGVSIVFASSILLNIQITWDFLLITYSLIQLIYLFNRYKEFEKDALTNPNRTKHIEKYMKLMPILIFFLIALIGVIVFYFSKFRALFFTIVMMVLGLSYTLFLKNATKKIIAFKTIFISFMQALSIILLAIYYSYPFNLTILLIFSFVFLRQFIYSSFYDIKDKESDRKEELLTLPVVLKRKNLIFTLHLLNFFSTAPIFLAVHFGLLPKFSLLLLLIVFFTFYYLQKLKKREGEVSYYFSQTMLTTEKILWSFLALTARFLL